MTDVTITAQMVKDLREKTGVGMSKCKEALEQSRGNVEEAISFLRKAGLTSAAKKEGRTTKEGAVVAHIGPTDIAIIEVDAETDFVVKNDKFIAFTKEIAEEAAKTRPASLEAFLQQPYSKDPTITIDQYRSLLIQTIGENIVISRVTILPKKTGESIGVYSHLGGKLLTAVILKGEGEEQLARDIGMHVAAAAPEYTSPEGIPSETLEKEKEIAREQVKGKPENIVEKILAGKLNAFFDQFCLTRQKYIRDDSVSVEEFVKNAGASRGKDLSIVGFVRWVAGKTA